MEIVTFNFEFDCVKKAVDVMKNLSKLDLQELFKKLLNEETVKKLVVQVIGSTEIKEENGEFDDKIHFITDKVSEGENVITNIDEFKKNLYLYPVVDKRVNL